MAGRISENLHSQGPGFVLYQGNCVEILAKLKPHSVDLIFADPPYFLSNGGFTCQSGRRAPVKKGNWDKSQGVQKDHAFAMEWLSACHRVLKPSGTLWVSGTHHVIFSIGFAMQQLGYKILNSVTWFKPNASPNLSCRYFTHSTETLIWASPVVEGKLLHTFNYQAMKAQNQGKQMRDLWSMPSPPKSEKQHGRHPTQKPLTLLQRVISSSSAEHDVVLDPFSGSGTTGLAALKLNRHYIGIELEPDYLKLSERRLLGAVPPRRTCLETRAFAAPSGP